MNKETKKEILVDNDRSGVEDSKCPLIATYKMQKCIEFGAVYDIACDCVGAFLKCIFILQ